jgi:hypothetical protein
MVIGLLVSPPFAKGRRGGDYKIIDGYGEMEIIRSQLVDLC